MAESELGFAGNVSFRDSWKHLIQGKGDEACLQPFFPDTVPGSVTDDLGKRNWTRKTSNECCLLTFLARSPSDIPLNMSSDHRKAKPCMFPGT